MTCDTQTSELTLRQASVYLAGRVRNRTPYGAVEYLACAQHRDPEAYRARIQLALNCLEIYRSLFPDEYARSDAPPFSLQAEQEFYQLIHYKIFPLLIDDMDVVQAIRREPRFFLPFIPLAGTQEHVWKRGQYVFEDLQTVFRLALVLSRCPDPEARNWQALTALYGLTDVAAPAAPLATIGWSLFNYACRVEESPLKYMPLAFHLIAYDTGNMWLDLPQGVGSAAVGWHAREVARLCIMWQQARQMTIASKKIDNWLDANPRAHIGRVVQLWNDAAQKEKESGYGGMLVDELVEHGATPVGDNHCILSLDERVLEGLI